MYHLIRQWFDTSNPDSELACRYITLVTWLIGSMTLMVFEWGKNPFDTIAFLAVPIAWAVIISLPVMATHAWRRNRFAAVLLGLSAIVGSIYTMGNTISRQSIQRDSSEKSEILANEKRDRLNISLLRNQAMLDKELKLFADNCQHKLSKKYDCDAIEASVAVYSDAVKGNKSELSEIGNPQVLQAGESRFAKLLFWMNYDKARNLIADIYPAIWGLFLELAALSSAMYGWQNYGLMRLDYVPSRLADKLFAIEVLEQQLAIANEKRNTIDARLLKSKLNEAKERLKRELG